MHKPINHQGYFSTRLCILSFLFSGFKNYTATFNYILDQSHNSHNEDNTKFTNTLSATELSLYWEGYAAAADFIKWKHSRTQTLEHSWLIELHERRNKRRRRF